MRIRGLPPLASLVSLLAPPLCAACGAHCGEGNALCGECRAGLRWLGAEQQPCEALAVWAPVAYEGPARAIVAGVKFRGALGLVELMAAQIAANAPPGVLDTGRLVPVPLHPARRRKRGFNQAERLAAALARRTGLPIEDCLSRTGSKGTQVGRDRAERQAAIAGAVSARRMPRDAKTLVLVDDVVTSGGTLLACAAALRAAGARNVRAVAYARTPGR